MSTTSNIVRKFIDLVRQISGKWANWDPPIPIDVGDYGTIDKNGELVVEGNIYGPKFQKYLDDNKIDLGISLKDYPPEYGKAEQDYIVASTGVKKRDLQLNANVNIPQVASATIRGTWTFQEGKRGALIILHQPQQKFIDRSVQTKILEAKVLEGKNVVMSAFACSAYLLYLSDKSGENVSVAFSAETAENLASGKMGLGWWTDNESALLRRAYSLGDDRCFTPLFAMREKVKRSSWLIRRFRGGGIPSEPEDSAGEYVWQDVYQPWRPLDEDGNIEDDD